MMHYFHDTGKIDRYIYIYAAIPAKTLVTNLYSVYLEMLMELTSITLQWLEALLKATLAGKEFLALPQHTASPVPQSRKSELCITSGQLQKSQAVKDRKQ